MIPIDDCDDCRPDYLRRRLDSVPPSTIAFSSLPFVFTFLIVAAIVSQKLLPLLYAPEKGLEHGLTALNRESSTSGRSLWRKVTSRRVATATCAATIALSAVLVELLLCEISNTLNPAARGLALRITLLLLLFLIIAIIPALHVHSLVNSWFRSTAEASTSKSHLGIKTLFKAGLLLIWLGAFWYLSYASVVPNSLQNGDATSADQDYFIEACLERIGIVGISLMASLAGFAAVSSIWQTFGVRHRLVRESDIARKEAGLSATQDMLSAKMSRLRALQHRQSDPARDKGFLTRMVGSIRGSDEKTEQRSLEMEISGLETMSLSLESSASALRSQLATQERSSTSLGRLTSAFGLGFAIYCLYRIAATSVSSLRRWWQPDSTFATSDPINNFLALLTTHYDESLDREAWARQISFALSGVMLLLSFSAVLQTFRLFSRFAPNAVQHAQSSLPLIISQIAGTYVISSALLLRSNLPPEVSSVITEALGSPLDGRFVEAWFESWFLVAVGITATGILISRKVGTSDLDDWDDAGDLEMGKMS